MTVIDDLKATLGFAQASVIENFADWQPGAVPTPESAELLRRQLGASGIPLLDEIVAAHLDAVEEDRPGVRAPELRERLPALDDSAAAELAAAALERAAFLRSGERYRLGLPEKAAANLAQNLLVAAAIAVEGRSAQESPVLFRLLRASRHIYADGEAVEKRLHLLENFAIYAMGAQESGSAEGQASVSSALADFSRQIDKIQNWNYSSTRRSAVALQLALCSAIQRPENDSPLIRAEKAMTAAAAELRKEVEAAASPLLRRYIAAALDERKEDHRPLIQENSVLAEIKAAIPEQRGELLVECLRVSNLAEEVAKRGAYTLHEFFPPSAVAKLLESLFVVLLRRKALVADEDAAFLVGQISSVYWLRDLRLLKIAEGTLAKGPAPKTRAALTELLAWLEEGEGRRDRKIRKAALPRLHALLGTDDAAESDADPEPPAITQIWRPTFQSLCDFYGDLADLRKVTPNHIEHLSRLVEQAASWVPERYDETVAQARAAGRTGPHGIIWSDERPFAPEIERLRRRVEAIAALPEGFRAPWEQLHKEARSLEGKSKPSKAWLEKARSTLAALDETQKLAFLSFVLDATEPHPSYPLASDNVARALIYLAIDWPADKVGPLLSNYARKVCFQTVKGVGIKGGRLGNACLMTLMNLPVGGGVPYLARLFTRIKYPSVRKKIGQALDEAAAKAGVTRGELEELALSDHGLDPEGRIEIAIGEGAAVIAITGTASAGITWRAPSGKTVKSTPAALKPLKEEIKAAKALVKEIEGDLSAQVTRLQKIYLDDRRWPADLWRQRYAEHPLQAGLVGRLIWNLKRGDDRCSGVWRDGAFRDIAGRELSLDGAEMTLWHPIDCSVEEVLAWRVRLAALEIVQPFKQAHREVYLVTEAERHTGIYSNRFAGHIVKQHQMMTLARLNGWSVTHRIWADVPNDEPTHLVVPAHGIIAEYWTKGAGGEEPEVTDSQAYVYLSTDQVRFYAIKKGEEASKSRLAQGPARGDAIPMDDVPPIIFSEVMRHCDLFVGVASIASDPNWGDGGADAEHPDQWRRDVAQAYWQQEAFGELSITAETRRQLLEVLLPKLTISTQARLEGRFLVVQGKLRSYKIHLGSGNILMEPNDQYLCIVPDRARMRGAEPLLPFEGDNLLAVILSKAQLLAADDKIADPMILQQLKLK